MYTADYFIEKLQMTAHVEGGYFSESYRSNEGHERTTEGVLESRSLWSSIYFLLRDGEVSNFHRLKSDEMWYYQSGSPLSIYMISPEGKLTIEKLGLQIDAGEKPQVLVPKGYIFGSAMNEPGYGLVGCMVSPGFVFEDFELFSRQTLLELYPEHEAVVLKLSREV